MEQQDKADKVIKGLDELARQYRQEGNHSLATDINELATRLSWSRGREMASDLYDLITA